MARGTRVWWCWVLVIVLQLCAADDEIGGFVVVNPPPIECVRKEASLPESVAMSIAVSSNVLSALKGHITLLPYMRTSPDFWQNERNKDAYCITDEKIEDINPFCKDLKALLTQYEKDTLLEDMLYEYKYQFNDCYIECTRTLYACAVCIGANPNVNHVYPVLAHSIEHNDYPLATYLLTKNASPNMPVLSYNKPVWFCAKHPVLAQLLLEHKANFQIVMSPLRNTILHYARILNDDLLIFYTNHVDANSTNIHGDTPLHTLVKPHEDKIFEEEDAPKKLMKKIAILLKAGADPLRYNNYRQACDDIANDILVNPFFEPPQHEFAKLFIQKMKDDGHLVQDMCDE